MEKRPELSERERLRKALSGLVSAYEVYRSQNGSLSRANIRDSQAVNGAWHEALDALNIDRAAAQGLQMEPLPRQQPSMNTPEPLPTKEESEHPACWDLVLCHPTLAKEHLIPLRKDMEERDRQGAEKYGVRLRPFNGRNALVDLYQELLDAAVYCAQAIYEYRYGYRALEGLAVNDEERRAKTLAELGMRQADLERAFELVVTCAKIAREAAQP